jgi:hypothetical protein
MVSRVCPKIVGQHGPITRLEAITNQMADALGPNAATRSSPAPMAQ